MTSFSWQRQNHIVSLPQKSVDLVRLYSILQGLDGSSISETEILSRAQHVATAAANNVRVNDDENGNTSIELNSHDSAEYRCLETGGFLMPSVSQHPWYKDSSLRCEKLMLSINRHDDQIDVYNITSNNSKQFAVLDLGCGMGADGRQMLVDGFATHVVGVDRSALYMRLGCELFGDDVGKSNRSAENKEPILPSRTTFIVANIAEKHIGNDDDDDMVVDRIQTALEQFQSFGTTDSKTTNTSREPATMFDAVYAGKFFHCLETEENLRITLMKLRKLLATNGCLFGVFGRNYHPVFECASCDEFSRVLSAEGFVVAMMKEEVAGATWFCAYNKRGTTDHNSSSASASSTD